MGIIQWLENHYKRYCDGDWEHSFGVKICSNQTPGWVVQIDLENTALEYTYFKQIELIRDDHDWLKCRIENSIFIGEGGVSNLAEIIQTFADWSDSNSNHVDILN